MKNKNRGFIFIPAIIVGLFIAAVAGTYIAKSNNTAAVLLSAPAGYPTRYLPVSDARLKELKNLFVQRNGSNWGVTFDKFGFIQEATTSDPAFAAQQQNTQYTVTTAEKDKWQTLVRNNADLFGIDDPANFNFVYTTFGPETRLFAVQKFNNTSSSSSFSNGATSGLFNNSYEIPLEVFKSPRTIPNFQVTAFIQHHFWPQATLPTTPAITKGDIEKKFIGTNYTYTTYTTKMPCDPTLNGGGCSGAGRGGSPANISTTAQIQSKDLSTILTPRLLERGGALELRLVYSTKLLLPSGWTKIFDAITGEDLNGPSLAPTPTAPSCVPEGQPLGAVSPTNTAVCCPGLVATQPTGFLQAVGSRGTCRKPTVTVTSITPASGPAGITVTLTGTGFADAKSYSYYQDSLCFLVNGACYNSYAKTTDDNKIQFTVPASVPPGTYGMQFQSYKGSTVYQGTTFTQTFTVTASTSYQLKVINLGSGAGKVSSTINLATGDIDCGGQCTKALVNGTPVTLTATPSAGSNFGGWGGAACVNKTALPGGSSCTFTLNSDQTVTATFNSNEPVSVSPPSISSISPSQGTPDTAIILKGAGFDGLGTLNIKLNGQNVTSLPIASNASSLHLTADNTLTFKFADIFNASTLSSGTYQISVSAAGQSSNEVSFTLATPLSIIVSDITPRTPQSITVGATIPKYIFAYTFFDATASGEDVWYQPQYFNMTLNGSGPMTSLTNCALYANQAGVAGEQLTNFLNPSSVGTQSFTWSGRGFIIPKGGTRSILLACDISGATPNGSTFQWGIPDGAHSTFVYSPTSGSRAIPNQTASLGTKVTVISQNVAAPMPTISVTSPEQGVSLQSGQKVTMNFNISGLAYPVHFRGWIGTGSPVSPTPDALPSAIGYTNNATMNFAPATFSFSPGLQPGSYTEYIELLDPTGQPFSPRVTTALAFNVVSSAPVVSSISATSGKPGDIITVKGSNFAGNPKSIVGQSTTLFVNLRDANNGSQSAPNTNLIDSQTMTFEIPSSVSSGTYQISVGGIHGYSNSVPLTITVAPPATPVGPLTISSVSPTTVKTGDIVTVTGSNLTGTVYVRFVTGAAGFNSNLTKILSISPDGQTLTFQVGSGFPVGGNYKVQIYRPSDGVWTGSDTPITIQ